MIDIILPVKVISEANTRCHWAVRARRFKQQRLAVRAHLRSRLSVVKPPCTVTLTRIGARRLDSDNLAGAFKAVRDEIAELLGVDDGSDAVVWRYEQTTAKEAGKPAGYNGVRVQAERKEEE